MDSLPEVWISFLADSGALELLDMPLQEVAARRRESTVFPPSGTIFRAFELTPPDKVRTVLLGQDPYHDDGQAQGLAFSVPDGCPLPPSLKNIFKEYSTDLGREIPVCGSLENWASGGVLLLNSVLTVDAHRPGSHRKFGWERFTDAVISTISRRSSGVSFILWGSFAMRKADLIDREKHRVICGVHPSPLSAYRGFFGSRPFSRAERPGWNWPEL